MKTVIFDFDGVIHQYKSGWRGPTYIPDPPVPGIKEEIKKIRESGYRVVVVSTRCYRENGIEAIEDYLKNYGIEVDEVTDMKPPAVVSIDDRAICFEGKAEGLLEKIQRFKSWLEK